jgi:hypothetical protein
MQICIPNVGQHLELTSDWPIDILHDYDNIQMLKHMNVNLQYYVNKQKVVDRFVMPAGAWMKIEQVYIRKGSADASSLKLLWRNPPGGKSIRFRASLADVNKLDCAIYD